MRSEELLALSAAHGVDFLQAARVGTAPAKRDVTIRRHGTLTSTVLLEPRVNRARGGETRSSQRPEWTTAEIGQAAQGVPDILFHAALFAFAGDRGSYWKLHAALYREALALQAERGWPAEVCDIHDIGRPYLKHLAKLVLDEDASPQVFRTAPHLYAIVVGVSDHIWDKSIAERFHALRYVWIGWLGHAAAIMQPRLTHDDS
jgi:hypothetical protein